MTHRAIRRGDHTISKTAIGFEDDEQALFPLIRLHPQHFHAGQANADSQDLARAEVRMMLGRFFE
jgi:hypothetical protein